MKKFIFFILLSLINIAILKGQTTASRLLAQSAYIGEQDTFTLNDSSVYMYTGSNGGDLTHTLKYDNEITYAYNVGAIAIDTYNIALQTFDANDNIISNTTQLWSSKNPEWTNEFRTIYKYDANNNDTLSTYQTWDTTKWLSSQQTHNAYVNNHLDTVTVNDTVPGGWIGTYKTIYTYSASNLTNQLFQTWDYTRHKWYTTQQINSYYDSFSEDTADITQTYDTLSTEWTNNLRKVYLYNVNHNNISQYDFTWTLSSTWDSSTETFYYYDANSNDTTTINLNTTGGSLDTIVKNTYTYNSYNQQTYHRLKGNPTFFFVPNYKYYFYYETYTTGVNLLSVNSDQLSVYPNPTSNFIHLSVLLQQTQPVQLSLFNILGQQVWGADIGIAKHIEATIPVTNLVNGIYVLRVNAGGTTQQREVVVAR